MDRLTAVRKKLLAAAVALAALAAPLAMAADMAAGGRDADRAGVVRERVVDGIRLLALAPDANANLEISILPPTAGLDRLEAALELIRRQSPVSARTIERLKAAGEVSLTYYPNSFRDRNRLNTQTVALFLPDFLKQRGLKSAKREFSVVVNQFGVKWPVAELAAVIVHELAGHGVQHLENRIVSGRLLDLECEASLLQEQAYQDFGVAKKSRSVVLFRRQMEYRYCADFRRYMGDRVPKRLALWDALNPDVPALLGMFRSYRGTQSAMRTDAKAPINARSR